MPDSVFDEIYREEESPFPFFRNWRQDAQLHERIDPDAAALATTDAEGYPNVRIVLVKDVTEDGFVFYTNTRSVKGEELRKTPFAALCFYWKILERQVRIRGPVAPVLEAQADAYYASRPRESQIGAWASQQSEALPKRRILEARVLEIAQKYPGKNDIPRPPFWSGYRVTPLSIEFWQARPSRLHDRVLFTRETTEETVWEKQRLYP